jgi:hypothetical protein
VNTFWSVLAIALVWFWIVLFSDWLPKEKADYLKTLHDVAAAIHGDECLREGE